MIHFRDSASPENIPSGSYAAVYINGRFTWSQRDRERMAKIFCVSVQRDAFWAKFARCIDVEKEAALPEDVPGFIAERRAHGFNDATVYVNRSNIDAVKAEVEQHHLAPPFYWVATLDGTQHFEGAWAVQYAGGVNAPFDVSVLHGINNFVTP